MLNEQLFDAPVIHVVSESPRLEMLQTRLRQVGLRPVPVRGSYLPPDSAPAMIDALTERTHLDGIENRVIVTIGRMGRSAIESDIHLADVSQIESLPARLAIWQRETQRQREIELRARTSEKMGATQPEPQTSERARVLWLGQDAPFLNAMKSSLSEGAVSLVAAISRLTAEDYLASGTFQTLVLCPSAPDDEAARLLATIKSLALPAPPKTVLILRPEMAQSFEASVLSQADQVIDLTGDVDKLASGIQAIASESATTQQIYQSDTTDGDQDASGLVSREFLESHVDAQMQQADEYATPLSVIAFTLDDTHDFSTVARVVRSHLRESDLAGHLDATHICITLPETNYRGAVVLARRIEEALNQPINWRAIERRQFHTLRTLLGGLTAKSLLTRKRLA